MDRTKQAVEVLLEAVGSLQAVNTGNEAVLSEALDAVRGMLAYEDRGWVKLSGDNDLSGGLTLDDLKAWSVKIRESVVGAPWMKRGLSLRSSYIWKGGIQYKGISQETRGAKNPRVQEKIDLPANQRAFFNSAARRRREGMLYHDGLAVWIGDNVTKKLEVVPLNEITAVLTDPDHSDIVMAYRRAWSRRQPDGKPKEMVRWYFVDYFTDDATDTISYGGKSEEVDRNKTAFDMHANGMEGWTYGVPDALSAWIWAQIGRDLYMDGVAVSQSMATITSKVTSASKGAGQNAAVQFASPQSAGSTAVLGAGTDLASLASAGKGYDFSTIREIVSLIAAALEVSNIHLTSNPGDAGASYGSAATLDEPVALAMMERRAEHITLDERVLRWMGANDAKAYFEPYEDGTAILRKIEAITLPWLQGIMPEEEYKDLIARALGVPKMLGIPAGVLLPNNEKSGLRPDVDDPSSQEPTKTAATPGQGRSNGVGGAQNRDKRTDLVS